MSKKLPIILLLLCWSTFVLADEFKVKNFKHVPNSMAARMDVKTDHNDEKCALIRIRSDLTDVVFDSRKGITEQIYKNGEYWLYVSPGEQEIIFMKEGFARYEYVLPVTIRSLEVYTLDLTGSERFTVTIMTKPELVEFQFDGEPFRAGTGIQDVSQGKHIVRVNLMEYAKLIDTIFVSKEKTYFEYELEALRQQTIRITSEPEGALILLDGRQRQTTNREVFEYPGEHRLSITKDLYIPIDTVIQVTPDMKEVHFDLVRNTAMGGIYVEPADASILFDNAPLETNKRTEFEAGRHSLIVKKEGYYTYEENILVQRDSTFNLRVELERITGSLQVSVNPFDAGVYLLEVPDSANVNLDDIKEEDLVYKSWTGSRQVDSIPIGVYNLKSSKRGWESQTIPITITENQLLQKSFELLEYKRVPKSKGKAIAWSVFFPGAGQWYSKQSRGWLYFLSIGGGAASYIYFNSSGILEEYNDARDSYERAVSISSIERYKSEMEEKHNTLVQNYQYRDIGFYVGVGAYALSVLDAIVFGQRKFADEKVETTAAMSKPDVNFKVDNCYGNFTYGIQITF